MYFTEEIPENCVQVKLTNKGLQALYFYVNRRCIFYKGTKLYNMMRFSYLSGLRKDRTYVDTSDHIMRIFGDDLDTNIEAWLDNDPEVVQGRN